MINGTDQRRKYCSSMYLELKGETLIPKCTRSEFPCIAYLNEQIDLRIIGMCSYSNKKRGEIGKVSLDVSIQERKTIELKRCA